MTTAPRPTLPEAHPQQTDGVRAAMEAIYNWNYDG